MTKHPTFFCDIDGTIFKYRKFETYLDTEVEVLPGVIESMQNWFQSGAHIVLTTARPESLREHTVKELELHGIPYHQLVMGIGRAERYLINDSEEEGVERAIAISLNRNTGFNFKI
jgi:ribonucleotide monophosphatase NagD (HAD superfamily)